MVPFPQDIWKDISFSKLYPIVSLKDIKIVPKLFGLGIEWVQIREKELNLEEHLDDLKKLTKMASEKGFKVIINDYVEVAKIIEAQGVHLGQEDLSPEVARKLLGEGKIIGLSTYSREEIEEGINNPFVDYIAIGPIFATPFKEREPLGLEILKKYVNRGKKIVAIGGIGEENILKVLKTGVDRVAFIRFLDKIIEK
ncbi:MAG: thiamine phosphate synthase [Thermoanaerobaculia bacterium]